MVAFHQTKNGLNVFIKGKACTIAPSHINYELILEKVRDTNTTEADIDPLLEVVTAVENWSKGLLKIDGDKVFYNGKLTTSAFADRVLNLVQKNRPIDYLVKFMDNLQKNPSHRAVTQLYGFLDACNLPITADGFFLTYKYVDNNYRSVHATPEGDHLDNSVGKVVKMPRNLVNEDPNETCSSGLHVCSFSYLGGGGRGGRRIVICKVNPEHVVAVPTDYNNSKMRVCEYEVVGEVPDDGKEHLAKYSV